MAKPIVKWVGGKRQLLPVISELMPKKYNKYVEPFFGGGAVFFSLEPSESVINDYNPELTNLYSVVRDNPDELMSELDILQEGVTDKEYFLSVRAQDRLPTFVEKTPVQRAGRFMYLNRTAFNGMWRVNSKGEYNVPFANYKNPTLKDERSIKDAHRLLKKTRLLTGDFMNVKDFIEKEDFVYIDPPYHPLNETSSFTGYTDKGFNKDDQYRVLELCRYIHKIGAFFMLSNSSADFIKEIYNDDEFNISYVDAKRFINANKDGRGAIKEIIVTNY